MKNFIRVIFCFLSLFFIKLGFADDAAFPANLKPTDPIPVLQDLSNQMIAALQKNKASMQRNPHVVYGIVHKILLPHADLQAMARSALGRSAWTSASDKDQKAFVAAFTDLMIHTYAAGLSSYTDQKVQFEPLREPLTAGKNRAEVNSKIIRTDGPPIPVSYRVIYKQVDEKDKATDKTKKVWEWQVYDFSVEGISMIQSFRSQFSSELSGGLTVPELTKKLIQHNQDANS